MDGIMRIDTVRQYNDYFGVDTPHPQVSVVEGVRAKPLRFCRKLYNVYAILVKDTDCGSLKYGRSVYDYRQGAMLFLAPGQMMGSEDDGELHQPEGWALTFHPDLLRGTALAKTIGDYTYFSYNANEALHLSAPERQAVVDCMVRIREELRCPADKHSRSLIVDHLKLLLDYCVRFYDRQFVSRKSVNSDILARFEVLLDDYYRSGKSAEDGMLTVRYCADRLCLSANYFSDLLRKETGDSALRHIQRKTLEVAKERILETSKSFSEIAYDLGFPYPQHFSRWFKKMEGCTPNDYRTQGS